MTTNMLTALTINSSASEEYITDLRIAFEEALMYLDERKYHMSPSFI